MTSNIQNNFIQAFMASNKLLVKTLVVKSSYGAYAINQELIRLKGDEAVDQYDATTWKYYLNTAGKYHSTDIPMYVISLDTKETILFTPENLVQHTATAEAYRHGTRYYYALARSYPKQVYLINCILTPTDIQVAIDAPDGKILAYPSYLVEENETTLISELESFINVFSARWEVQGYQLTQPYYAFMHRVALGSLLISEVNLARIRRCKTDEVHSFHLRQYLASHHRLDRWLPYLTREQALWLYRNITTLERDPGSAKTFQTLITNILDKRFIPLVEYSVRQVQVFDDNGYPEIQARRKQLSLAAPASAQQMIPIEELYHKESEIAYGSALYLETHKGEMNHLMQTSSSSVIQTKDLESSMVDLSSSVPDPLEEVLLRQLVAMTHDGLYNVIVNFQDSKTSMEYSLSAWDAVLYMTYLLHKSLKDEFTVVPCAYNVKYRMHPRPPLTDLTKLLTSDTQWLYPVAQELVRNQPVLTECFSVTMFYDMAYKIYEECQKHWKLLANTHDLYARATLEQMILKLFAFQNRDFSKGEDAEAWRARLNLPVYDYTYEEAQELIKEIFTKATGYVVDDTKQLRSIQKALLELFGTLSSYSIQIIREINDSPIIYAGGTGLRVGNVRERIENETAVRINLSVMDAQGSSADHAGEGHNLKMEVIALNDSIYDHIEIPIESYLDVESISDFEVIANTKPMFIDTTLEIIDPVSGQPVVIPSPRLEDLASQAELKKLFNSELYT